MSALVSSASSGSITREGTGCFCMSVAPFLMKFLSRNARGSIPSRAASSSICAS